MSLRSLFQFSSNVFASTSSSAASVPGQALRRCYSGAGYLGSLKPAPGSNKKKVRVGRGDSSGRGNTSGRGNKGQNARSGRPHPRFEGGQTPLTMAFPKRGFTPPSVKQKPEVLPLGRLYEWIQAGRIDPAQPITLRELHLSGCVNGIKAGGVKLLSDAIGATPTPEKLPPLQIIVNKASKSAIEAVEQAGGRIVCRYYNALGVRAVTKPEAFMQKGLPIPRLADPIKRNDIEYYHRVDKRGYLALQNMAKQQQQKPSPEAAAADAPSSS